MDGFPPHLLCSGKWHPLGAYLWHTCGWGLSLPWCGLDYFGWSWEGGDGCTWLASRVSLIMWLMVDDVWGGRVEILPFNPRTRESTCICPADGLKYWFLSPCLCSWRRQVSRWFPSSNDNVPLLNFFKIIVLSCSSSLVTSWSSSKTGMLWLCHVGSGCPVLCGVAPFSARQPPNLTSYFQKEECTSCF